MTDEHAPPVVTILCRLRHVTNDRLPHLERHLPP